MGGEDGRGEREGRCEGRLGGEEGRGGWEGRRVGRAVSSLRSLIYRQLSPGDVTHHLAVSLS